MGILQRLFGRDPKQPKEAFFLEADDAKTYGDIDYMRKSTVVKRTFAKTISGGGGEYVQEVSNMQKRIIRGEEEQKQKPEKKPATPSFGSFGSTGTERRRPSNNNGGSGDLDFRNMARGINKKR